MSVIVVDFSKKNGEQEDNKPVKSPVTFSLIDGETGTELDILVMVDCGPEALTTEAIISQLHDARLRAEEQFAAHVFDLDDKTSRNLEEIYDNILIDDIFLGTPSKREVSQYIVSGIKLDEEYISPSSRLVYGVNAVDADLQMRLSEAIDNDNDLSMGFDRVLEYITRMSCEKVALATDTDTSA